MSTSQISYKRHRFPPEIIAHAVWLYFRFQLSFCDVEDILAERGVDVSYETIRRWVFKFGRIYARRIRGRRCEHTGRWRLDEISLKIGDETRYLWRAVDDEGVVLHILVQPKRDRKAALKLMRHLLKKRSAPTTIITDRLRSYGAAFRELGLIGQHFAGGRLNNRPEVSHQPTRQREKQRRRFRSPGSAQQFLSIHAAVYNLFNVQRHLISRQTLKSFRSKAMACWREVAAA